MPKIDVSVVIPVKNGQRYLDSVLAAVFFQEIGVEFEVVIIDSGSKDRTLDIIKKYPVRLYQIEEKEFNHGLTRNLGIAKAAGEYIVLMTSDAIPYDNYWMRELVNTVKEDENIAGAYSRQIPHRDASIISQIRVKRFFTFDKKRRESRISKSEDYERLSGKEKYCFCNFDNVSSCIRKSVWQKVPFPKTDFAEDLEWAKKILSTGKKIVYQPNSIVYHSHEFSLRDWYNKNRVNSKKIYSLFGVKPADSFLQHRKIYNILPKPPPDLLCKSKRLGLRKSPMTGNKKSSPKAIFLKTIIIILIRIFRDIYSLFRNTRQLNVLIRGIFLIPLFSLAGILGEYEGIREFKHSDEDSSGCS